MTIPYGIIISEMKTRIVVASGIVFLLLPAFVSSKVNAASPSISRSYKSYTKISTGSIVSLVKSKTNYVVPANSSNIQQLTGVVVLPSQSLLAVNPSINSVQVAIEGVVSTLVSNVNGNIKAGQGITVSPFNGVGMKANNGDKIIGTALTSFNNSTNGSTTEKIKGINNKVHTIRVGYTNLDIGITTYNDGNAKTNSLQRFIASTTGHSVSTVRIILGLIIAIVAIISIVTLIYASIYSSIVSIGRNPLAKSNVFKSLLPIILMILVIAALASLAIYLILY